MKRVLFGGILFGSLVLGLSRGSGAVENPRLLFEQANQAYREGSYARAANLYESLLAKGFGNAQVHYNLGNAYFKDKHAALAILHYEKARHFKPREADIGANLRYVSGLLEYRIEDKRNWYLKTLESLLRLFTEQEIALLTLSLGVFFWASWAIPLYRGSVRLWGWKRKTLLTITLVCLSLWGLKTAQERWVREAVVLKHQAAVRYGPSYRDQVAFRLGEGMKVRIKKSEEDWVRVDLVNGETGWMVREEMGEI